MHVLDGYCKSYGVVNHVGDVELGVAFRYFQKLVGIVVVIRAVFYKDVKSGIDGPLKVVETAVADERNLTFDGKSDFIQVAFVVYINMYVKVGIADVGAFHIDEKLLLQLVVEGMTAMRQCL